MHLILAILEVGCGNASATKWSRDQFPSYHLLACQFLQETQRQ